MSKYPLATFPAVLVLSCFWQLQNIQGSQIYLKWLLSRTNVTCSCSWAWMESHKKRIETSDVQHIKRGCGFYEFLSFVKGLSPKRRQVGFQLPKLYFFSFSALWQCFSFLIKWICFHVLRTCRNQGFPASLLEFSAWPHLLQSKQRIIPIRQEFVMPFAGYIVYHRLGNISACLHSTMNQALRH